MFDKNSLKHEFNLLDHIILLPDLPNLSVTLLVQSSTARYVTFVFPLHGIMEV